MKKVFSVENLVNRFLRANVLDIPKLLVVTNQRRLDTGGKQNMSTVKSLAGTDRDYVSIQGRVDGVQLKIQGAGPEVNRDYGVSIVVPIPTDLANWMKGINATLSSMAHTSQRYFPMQAAELDFVAEKVRVQVAGSKLNRSYGAVFSIANLDLANFVEQALAEVEEEDEDYDDDYDDEEIEDEDAVVELI